MACPPSLPPADIRLTRLSCTPCRYWIGSNDGTISCLLWDPTMYRCEVLSHGNMSRELGPS